MSVCYVNYGEMFDEYKRLFVELLSVVGNTAYLVWH